MGITDSTKAVLIGVKNAFSVSARLREEAANQPAGRQSQMRVGWRLDTL